MFLSNAVFAGVTFMHGKTWHPSVLNNYMYGKHCESTCFNLLSIFNCSVMHFELFGLFLLGYNSSSIRYIKQLWSFATHCIWLFIVIASFLYVTYIKFILLSLSLSLSACSLFQWSSWVQMCTDVASLVKVATVVLQPDTTLPHLLREEVVGSLCKILSFTQALESTKEGQGAW